MSFDMGKACIFLDFQASFVLSLNFLFFFRSCIFFAVFWGFYRPCVAKVPTQPRPFKLTISFVDDLLCGCSLWRVRQKAITRFNELDSLGKEIVGSQSSSMVTGIYVNTLTKFPCHCMVMHGTCCPSQYYLTPISKEHFVDRCLCGVDWSERLGMGLVV